MLTIGGSEDGSSLLTLKGCAPSRIGSRQIFDTENRCFGRVGSLKRRLQVNYENKSPREFK